MLMWAIFKIEHPLICSHWVWPITLLVCHSRISCKKIGSQLFIHNWYKSFRNKFLLSLLLCFWIPTPNLIEICADTSKEIGFFGICLRRSEHASSYRELKMTFKNVKMTFRNVTMTFRNEAKSFSSASLLIVDTT